jgi:NAD(P)H-flavin reductase
VQFVVVVLPGLSEPDYCQAQTLLAEWQQRSNGEVKILVLRRAADDQDKLSLREPTVCVHLVVFLVAQNVVAPVVDDLYLCGPEPMVHKTPLGVLRYGDDWEAP